MKIQFQCPKCYALAEVDKSKSTPNFTAYKTKCGKCGSQTVPKIK